MESKKVKEKSKGKAKKKGKRGRRFKQAWQKLPDYPFWDQVYVRLGAGEACHSIAKWWKSKGEMDHLTVKSLAKYLGLYRTHGMKAEDKNELAPQDVHYINTLVKGYAHEIDVYQELVILINLQKKRLGMAVEKEQTVNFTLDIANKISDQLQSLIRDFFEYQVKTGRLPHVPQQFSHSHSIGGGNGDGDGTEIKSQRDEIQSKRRVAELSLTMMRLAAQGKQKAIPSIPKEDDKDG